MTNLHTALNDLNALAAQQQAIVAELKKLQAAGYELGPWAQVVVKLEVDYIAKPPHINWDVVPREFNYLAADDDGSVYLYAHRPVPRGGILWFSPRVYTDISRRDRIRYGYVPGTCTWRDSLIVRPGVEE